VHNLDGYTPAKYSRAPDVNLRAGGRHGESCQFLVHIEVCRSGAVQEDGAEVGTQLGVIDCARHSGVDGQ
jgi:hypothetical protein